MCCSVPLQDIRSAFPVRKTGRAIVPVPAGPFPVATLMSPVVGSSRQFPGLQLASPACLRTDDHPPAAGVARTSRNRDGFFICISGRIAPAMAPVTTIPDRIRLPRKNAQHRISVQSRVRERWCRVIMPIPRAGRLPWAAISFGIVINSHRSQSKILRIFSLVIQRPAFPAYRRPFIP